MKAPKVLVFGANGQIGSELCRVRGLHTVGVTRRDLDFSNLTNLGPLLDTQQPDIVINAAGYTAVEKAESEPQIAHRVNAEAPSALAEECRLRALKFVHYSTDYVFNGRKTQPYSEEDQTEPLGVYGRTKLEGERGVCAAGGQILVFRTSWVYNRPGNNFVLSIEKKARATGKLSVVDDQVGSPTWARDVAEATAKVLQLATRNSWDKWGLYHLTAEGQGSWYDFAKLIVDEAGIEAEVSPVSSSEYPSAAKRPAYSVLSNRKFERTFGFRIGDWKDRFRSFCRASKERQSDCASYS